MSQTHVITSPTKALPDPLLPQPDRTKRDADTPNVFQPKRFSFDPAALTKKYQEEREKRLKYSEQRGGLDQYRMVKAEPDDQFSQLLNDPYVNERLERDPIKEQCEVLIIGGGYGAQLTAVDLLNNNISDFRMIEKGGDFGGTWYWNRYPGAQCDIESYVYMPLLEAMNYVPTQRYAGGQELFHHAQAIGKKFDLYSRAHFQTEVNVLQWNDKTARWDVKTDRGDVFSARFVIPVAGPLHRPKLPNLPGLGTFKGHSFHTTRWDYEYTGGDPTKPSEPMSGLANKRVGVIGTGATAVQIVPHLGRNAKELYVFQRTPSSIDYRGNCETDLEWVKQLGEHWQTKRMDNFNIILNGGSQTEDLVHDGWTDIQRELVVRPASASSSSKKIDPEKALEYRQMLDFEKMEAVRKRCDDIVHDPATAEALKPYYNKFCKRPCFHDEYLPTFNRPNVHLIDTQGKGVERITEKGLVANGEEIELDCIIFATGFALSGDWSERCGLSVIGRGGLNLKDKWSDGPSTFHGYSSRNFPNFFPISQLQAGLSPNFLHMIGFQAAHISYIIGKCHERDIRTVEPTQQAEDEWVQTIIEAGKQRRDKRAECTPGYYNNEGQTSVALQKRASHGGGALEFMRILTEWRENGRLEGLELKPWSE